MATDQNGEWYWCLQHSRVEPLEGCRPDKRMGPYASPTEAEHWRERVAARNEEWRQEDERFDGDSRG